MSELSCKHCNKLFTELLSGEKRNEKQNHVRWCNPSADRTASKFQPKCSCLICKKELTIQGLNAHYEKHMNANTFKNKCKQCGKETNNEFFCGNSCAATFNNLLKPKRIKKPKNNANKKRPTFKARPCIICQTIHQKSGKTCSDNCKNQYLSDKMKQRIHSGTFDPNKNRGRGRKSYLEKSFEEWLTEKNILFIMEKPFKRLDVTKTYFADFYFPHLNLVIELDGSQHLKTVEYDTDRDAYINKVYGCTILRVSHKEYKNKSKIVEISKLLGLSTIE